MAIAKVTDTYRWDDTTGQREARSMSPREYEERSRYEYERERRRRQEYEERERNAMMMSLQSHVQALPQHVITAAMGNTVGALPFPLNASKTLLLT